MAEVRGVLGAVDAAELGLVLPHEHLFNDLSSAVAEPSYVSTRRLAEAEVGPGWQFLLRQDPYCCADNVAAKDRESVVREVTAFAAAGGGTLVDATGSAAIGRDPLALAAVAEATGVTIVMGTGAYLEKFEESASPRSPSTRRPSSSSPNWTRASARRGSAPVSSARSVFHRSSPTGSGPRCGPPRSRRRSGRPWG